MTTPEKGTSSGRRELMIEEYTVDEEPFYVQVNDELDLLIKRFDMQDQTITHSGEVHAQIPGLVSHIHVQKNEKIKTNNF
mgnify:CR=1 FL=1